MFDDRRQSAQTDCPEERSRKIDYPDNIFYILSKGRTIVQTERLELSSQKGTRI